MDPNARGSGIPVAGGAGDLRALHVAPTPPSLAASLLRPFVDLEPCARGPLYARGLEQYWAAFAEPRRPRFYLQRTLPRPFRAAFLNEAGLAAYGGEDPRDVAAELRSPRWAALCEALDAWPDLAPDARCRLVLLLHALCFYSLIATLVPRDGAARGGDAVELAYWGASARYVLGLPDRVADYDDADLSEFERLADSAGPAPAAFNAALKVLAHAAKTGAPADALGAARARAERVLDAVAPAVDDFTRRLFTSRLQRAAAFVPQRAGDRREVVRLMDAAERGARALTPADDAQELLGLENLHPVLESRVKEALWLGDLELALARARGVIELDPYESRAWLELGEVRRRRGEPAAAAEAYAMAATLGPPSSAIGRHMAGLCFRDLGQPLLAAFFFTAALDVDPRGTSPRDEIRSLPDAPPFEALKDWSLASFEL